MKKEPKETLTQLGGLVKQEKHEPRQKFMRVKDACEAYHMSRPKIMEMTLSAGALYRLNKTILINGNQKYYNMIGKWFADGKAFFVIEPIDIVGK